MLCWCKSLCDWMSDCLQRLWRPAGLAATPGLGQGASSLGMEICLSAPSAAGATGEQDVRRECAPCELLSLPPWLGLLLLQRLQMCTNKGGLKQNKSKQTNGIRVMGVGGLVHSDKHNDAQCMCV